MSSKESVWRTTYEAARIAVDIANASPDMFLPLKAVTGTLSVLIKNYGVEPPPATCHLFIADRSLQQTAANADQVGEIEERIQSPGRILAYPVHDQDSDELTRREALREFALPPLRGSDTSFNRVIRLQRES